MILEFVFENFRSFADTTKFSMCATRLASTTVKKVSIVKAKQILEELVEDVNNSHEPIILENDQGKVRTACSSL